MVRETRRGDKDEPHRETSDPNSCSDVSPPTLSQPSQHLEQPQNQSLEKDVALKMVHPMALSALFPNGPLQNPPVQPLPPYERLLDLCAANTMSSPGMPAPRNQLTQDCPLLLLHASLTDLNTSLSSPLCKLHPMPGQEPQWETDMEGMTHAFNSLLRQGVEEVRSSGMRGVEVQALVQHAENIVNARQTKVDTMMAMDETMGFLVL